MEGSARGTVDRKIKIQGSENDHLIYLTIFQVGLNPIAGWTNLASTGRAALVGYWEKAVN